MRIAINLAKKNIGNTGINPSVACLIEKDNHIIGIGLTGESGRPHAEYNAMSKCKDQIKGSTVYVTLEPCSMCLAAIVNSRLKKLIYGLPSPKYGAFSSNHSPCLSREKLIKNTEVYGGFYQSEISQIMKDFFEEKRGHVLGNRY